PTRSRPHFPYTTLFRSGRGVGGRPFDGARGRPRGAARDEPRGVSGARGGAVRPAGTLPGCLTTPARSASPCTRPPAVVPDLAGVARKGPRLNSSHDQHS